MGGTSSPDANGNRDPLSPGGYGSVLLRIALGCVLLLAALLKAYQLATEPTADSGMLTHRLSLAALVELELAFGLLLISGLCRRLMWLACLAFFLVGACATFYMGLTGESSCGCFGRIPIHPWYTLALDLSAVAGLLLLRPDLRRPAPVRHPRLRAVAAGLAFILAGGPMALAIAAYRPSRLHDDGQVAGEDRFVLLEPHTWVGKPLPLLGHVDVGDALRKGRWSVVLYHHRCPYCRAAVMRFEKTARELAGRTGAAEARLAFLELPPYAPEGKGIIPPDSPSLQGRVRHAREWFVTTPTFLVIHDGQVSGCQQGEDGKFALSESAGTGAPTHPSPAAIVALSGGQGEHDFGYVQPGTTKTVAFELRNEAHTLVRLMKTVSECKCITVPDPSTEVRPGQTARLLIRLDAPKESIRYSERVLLVTDDPSRRQIVLRIKAAVGMPLGIEPEELKLGTLIGGQQIRTEVALVNHGDKPVRPVYSTSGAPGCVVLVPKATIPPQGRLVMPMVIRDGGTGSGPRKVAISIHTDEPRQPTVTATAKYVASDSYILSPGVLHAGLMRPGEKRPLSLKLSAAKAAQDRFVTDCRLERLQGARAEIKVSCDSQTATVVCNVEAAEMPGVIDGAIRLVLAGFPDPVEIPLTGHVVNDPALAHGVSGADMPDDGGDSAESPKDGDDL